MTDLCACGKPIYAKGMCQYHWAKTRLETNPVARENKNKYQKEWYHKTHPSAGFRVRSDKIHYRRTPCKILKMHHIAMKHDPEHLTTEFIKKLINIECDAT